MLSPSRGDRLKHAVRRLVSAKDKGFTSEDRKIFELNYYTIRGRQLPKIRG